MKMETKPEAGALLVALLYIAMWAWLFSLAGCYREARSDGHVWDAIVQYNSTIEIREICLAPDGMSGTVSDGSGTVINATTILTAAHVAAGEDGMTCVRTGTTSDGKSYSLALGVTLVKYDLATLRSVKPIALVEPIVYGTAPLYGDALCESSADPMRIRRCGLAQYTTTPPGDLVHTIIVEPGNSGSGVYDRHGRLIGVITHRWSCRNEQYCGGKLALLTPERRRALGI